MFDDIIILIFMLKNFDHQDTTLSNSSASFKTIFLKILCGKKHFNLFVIVVHLHLL